jgi:hypothetical protein
MLVVARLHFSRKCPRIFNMCHSSDSGSLYSSEHLKNSTWSSSGGGSESATRHSVRHTRRVTDRLRKSRFSRMRVRSSSERSVNEVEADDDICSSSFRLLRTGIKLTIIVECRMSDFLRSSFILNAKLWRCGFSNHVSAKRATIRF